MHLFYTTTKWLNNITGVVSFRLFSYMENISIFVYEDFMAYEQILGHNYI